LFKKQLRSKEKNYKLIKQEVETPAESANKRKHSMTWTMFIINH